jgi:hypothetical protein
MARFPPAKWELHPVEHIDRLLEEVLQEAMTTAPLQAAAFVAVR